MGQCEAVLAAVIDGCRLGGYKSVPHPSAFKMKTRQGNGLLSSEMTINLTATV